MSHDLEKQHTNKLNKIKYKAKKLFYVDLFKEYGLQVILYFIQNLIIYQLFLNCVLMIFS